MTLDWSEQQNQRRIDSGVDDPGDAIPITPSQTRSIEDERCVLCGTPAEYGLCRGCQAFADHRAGDGTW